MFRSFFFNKYLWKINSWNLNLYGPPGRGSNIIFRFYVHLRKCTYLEDPGSTSYQRVLYLYWTVEHFPDWFSKMMGRPENVYISGIKQYTVWRHICGIYGRFQGFIGPTSINQQVWCQGSRGNTFHTWRIIPIRKWLVTPIYKPFSPFGRGITLHRELTNHDY